MSDSRFFCRPCAEGLGAIPPSWPALKDSPYRREKSRKHRGLTHEHQPVSIFADPSTAAHDDLLDATQRRGAVWIGPQGRTNLIFKTGRPIGWLCSPDGELIHEENVNLVALSTDARKVHGFSQSSTKFPEECEECGGPLFGGWDQPIP